MHNALAVQTSYTTLKLIYIQYTFTSYRTQETLSILDCTASKVYALLDVRSRFFVTCNLARPQISPE